MRNQPERSVLITDAARSQTDQLRSRQKRYVLMMAARVGCLILGAVLVGTKAPLLPVWLSLCAVGMVLLPWAAVLLANDRPPKRKAARPTRRPTPTPRSLAAQPTDAGPTGAGPTGAGPTGAGPTGATGHRTIDVGP